ncbi:MAG: hypothetical protein H7242_03930 [Microbacteriaceae bacterium]|nr:hypothetical protein [Burkholderiaceae bacterium]
MPLPTQPMPAEVLAALQRGQTLEATELLRKSTGMALPEAQALIEGHLGGLADRKAPPGAKGGFGAPKPSRSNGVLWLVVAFAVAAAIGYWFLRA